MGFKLVAYPMSLLAVSVHAMESALEVRSYLMGKGGTNNVARGGGDEHFSSSPMATFHRERHLLGTTDNPPFAPRSCKADNSLCIA